MHQNKRLDSTMLNQILNIIDKNGYKIDDRLPSERELAKVLNTNRNTLRETLKILQTMGIIDIRHGSGIYIKKVGPFSGDTISLWIILHKNDVQDVHVVKRTLDLKAAELIPRDCLSEVHEKLKESINKININTCSAEGFIKHDSEFHSIIREASGNKVLVNICNDLLGSIYDERNILAYQPERRRMSYSEHKSIVAAFETQNINFILQVLAAHADSVEMAVGNLN